MLLLLSPSTAAFPFRRWAFPDDGEAAAVDGCFWTRVPGGGFKVIAKEKMVAGAAGIKRGRGGAAADAPSVLDKIAAHGVKTPADLWTLNDTGSLTDGCGGWRQFRVVFAAPASFGKSYLAKRLLAYRSQQTIADGRGALPITTESIHVFSGTGDASIKHFFRHEAFLAAFPKDHGYTLVFRSLGLVDRRSEG